MHFKRWITALVALPFLIALIGWGPSWLLAVVICGVALVSLWEYFGIVFASMAVREYLVCGPAIALASCPVVFLAAHQGSVQLVWGAAFLAFAGVGLWMVLSYDRLPGLVETAGKLVIAVFYIPCALSFLVLMRVNSPEGTAWIFMTLCIVFAGDIAAYYAGTTCGRRKLCPRVSPGKTVEGALAGLAANLLMGVLFKLAVVPRLSMMEAVVMSIGMGAIGQVGDLFESVLKRSAGIKDSGFILPGHGGILDRIDALLFAIPVAFIFYSCLA